MSAEMNAPDSNTIQYIFFISLHGETSIFKLFKNLFNSKKAIKSSIRDSNRRLQKETLIRDFNKRF